MFDEGDENDFDTVLAEMEKEMSMADVMKELGYGCTVNVSQCTETLSLFLPLTAMTISRILGTIARTHAALEDNQNAFSTFCSALSTGSSTDMPSLSSWNIDVLVNSIKQLVCLSVVSFWNLDLFIFTFPHWQVKSAFFFGGDSKCANFRLLKPIGLVLLKTSIMMDSTSLMRRRFPFLCRFIDMHARFVAMHEFLNCMRVEYRFSQ